jgi:hypothetical protein
MLFIIINKILKKTLVMIRLKTVLWLICAKIEVFAIIFANTITPSWIICVREVPLARINIAAAAPRQLCPIIAIVAEPM